MPSQIKIVSSMAPKAFLLDVAKQYANETGSVVDVNAAGGVEVARRIGAGEPADAVVLSATEIDRLIAAGSVVAGSRTDLVKSPMAIAVRRGGVKYDVASAAAVRKAVLAAKSVGYSTGPSGVYLEKLLTQWGADQVKRVQASPGVPVGTLVAQGEAEIGFQQLSELIHLSGIDILGPLPAEIQLITTFSAGIPVACTQPDAVRTMLTYIASPAALPAKQRHGLDPA